MNSHRWQPTTPKFPGEHTPDPLGWIPPSGESDVAFIYAAWLYALLDACDVC